MKLGTSLALLVAVAAGTASAERSAEREAKALFKEANELAESGDLAGALDLFQVAYQRFPNPKILVNMAAVLEAMGRDAEAAQTYEKLIADAGASRSSRAQAEQKLMALDRRVGRVRIEVDRPGAQVLLDGKTAGESGQPLVLRLKPGGHAVLAKKDGYVPAAETVEIVAGQERAVALVLQPVGAAPVAATTSPPAGTGSPAPAPSAPAAAIDDPALSAQSEAPAADRPIWKRWPFWAGVGAVVAGGVVAGVLLSGGGDASLPAHDDLVDTR
jgi:hypothetical protein